MKLVELIKNDIPRQILDEICEQTTKNMSLFQIASLNTVFKEKSIMCPKRREN